MVQSSYANCGVFHHVDPAQKTKTDGKTARAKPLALTHQAEAEYISPLIRSPGLTGVPLFLSV